MTSPAVETYADIHRGGGRQVVYVGSVVITDAMAACGDHKCYSCVCYVWDAGGLRMVFSGLYRVSAIARCAARIKAFKSRGCEVACNQACLSLPPPGSITVV